MLEGYITSFVVHRLYHNDICNRRKQWLFRFLSCELQSDRLLFRILDYPSQHRHYKYQKGTSLVSIGAVTSSSASSNSGCGADSIFSSFTLCPRMTSITVIGTCLSLCRAVICAGRPKRYLAKNSISMMQTCPPE